MKASTMPCCPMATTPSFCQWQPPSSSTNLQAIWVTLTPLKGVETFCVHIPKGQRKIIKNTHNFWVSGTHS